MPRGYGAGDAIAGALTAGCDRGKSGKRGAGRKKKKNDAMSEVGFEPTPTEVDCDLNAAP